MKKYIKMSVYKSVEKDDYENGCGDSRDFGCIETRKFKSLKEAVNYITTNYGNDLTIIDNFIECQVTENADGCTPFEREIEAWKKGECDLYLARYTFFIDEVHEISITSEQLEALLPECEVIK